MSWNPALPPGNPEENSAGAIKTLTIPRSRDLGGFEVRHVLPAAMHRSQGTPNGSNRLPDRDAATGLSGFGACGLAKVIGREIWCEKVRSKRGVATSQEIQE